jgi:RimJ/RimL family protein N-acetyltransferase
MDALLMRPWSESDARGLREAIDEDVNHLKPWLSWTLEEPATLERTRARLRTYVEEYRTGRGFRYAITAVDQPTLILGGAGLNFRVGPGAHDVGYWVRRSAIRRGIAGAAIARLAVHAFSQGVERLVIQCDIGNTASAAVARALGFVFTGPASGTYPDGSARALYRFQMLEHEYRVHHAAAFQERARRVHLLPDQIPALGSSHAHG